MTLFYLERDQYSKNCFPYIYVQQYITNRNIRFIHCETQLSLELTSLSTKTVLSKVSQDVSI